MDFRAVGVLVVDDNRHARQILIEVLRALGVRKVYEAESVEQAMKRIDEAVCDLILADIELGGPSGLDLLRQLRRCPNPTFARLPFIIVSSHTEDRVVRAARDAGVTSFLRKPISVRRIADHLKEAVLDERMFVTSRDYVGPDRRSRSPEPYDGPRRRAEDQTETLSLD